MDSTPLTQCLVEVVQITTGARVNKRQMQNIAKEVTVDFDEFYDCRARHIDVDCDDLLVISTDFFGPARPSPRRDNRWGMVYVCDKCSWAAAMPPSAVRMASTKCACICAYSTLRGAIFIILFSRKIKIVSGAGLRFIWFSGLESNHILDLNRANS